MRVLMMPALIAWVFSSANAFAGYDDTWYKGRFWSQEYPPGFAVARRNTTIMARAAMDKDLPRNVACAMPYRAVIHPWNQARVRKSQIEFHSFSKIVKLVAKESFSFEVPIKKGDIIEYLYNRAEGFFEVRIKGREITAYQDLFDHVEEVPSDRFVEDDWAIMTCENGTRAHIYLPDVTRRDAHEPDNFAREISEIGPGMPGYGKARDLTEGEAVELGRKRRR